MKTIYKTLAVSTTSCVVLLFVAWVYGTEHMGCSEGLQQNLSYRKAK